MIQSKVENHESSIILISGWEMQCCGTPFAIGDSIKWLVSKWSWGEGYIAPEGIKEISYFYNEHSSDWQDLFSLTGKVATIKAVFESFVPNPENEKFLMRASGETSIRKVTYADGWDKDVDGKKFDCYIVDLENVSVAPARQSEVTFK